MFGASVLNINDDMILIVKQSKLIIQHPRGTLNGAIFPKINRYVNSWVQVSSYRKVLAPTPVDLVQASKEHHRQK